MSALPETAQRSSARLRELLRTLSAWPWLDTLRTLRQRFREDHLGLTASSLTFTTLIALVPLLTVMLAVFTAFPMFATFQAALEKDFLQTLVPDTIARTVIRTLTQFASKARSVGALGLLLFVATAIALMLTIDRTLNAIWRVRQPRPFAQRVLVYWAALTLGPLALGASLSMTSWALSASRGLVEALPGGVNLLFDSLQFGLLAATMAGLFHYVPNTFVQWRHAWAGALFVAVGFELAKVGLAWYVNAIGTFSAVYGAFATLPILLLWIYLGWVIVLLGAVIAAYAPSLQMRVVRRPDRPGWRFALALAMLAELERARRGQEGGLSLAQIAERLRADPLQLEPVADRMIEIGILGRLDEEGGQRHVIVGDPRALPAGPLIDALLLEPGAATRAFARRADLAGIKLAELIDSVA